MSLWILEEVQCPEGSILLVRLAQRGSSMCKQDEGRRKFGAMFRDGGFLRYPLETDRLVEVMRILEVFRCGASCDWTGNLIMVQAPVYAVPYDIFYARVFSVSGGTLSARASFLFPEQRPWCHAPKRPVRIRNSEIGTATSSTSL